MGHPANRIARLVATAPPSPSPGALGGRLDHTLANLNSLHMFPHLAVTLWGDGNLVRLVRPGRTLIVPDEE